MNQVATLREALSVAGASIDETIQFDEGLATLLSESIPDGDDNQVAFVADISQVKAIVFYAAEDLTIETNDSAAPDDTINLTGGKPFVWSNTYLAQHFSADITTIYVSNGTGSAVTLEGIKVEDPTV